MVVPGPMLSQEEEQGVAAILQLQKVEHRFLAAVAVPPGLGSQVETERAPRELEGKQESGLQVAAVVAQQVPAEPHALMAREEPMEVARSPVRVEAEEELTREVLDAVAGMAEPQEAVEAEAVQELLLGAMEEPAETVRSS